MTDTSLLGGSDAATDDAAGKDTAASAAAAGADTGKDVADPAKAAADIGAGKDGKDADKTDGANADGKAKDGKDDAGKDGAPEKYEAFTLPDGMKVDEKRLEAFTPIAKELNLSQENAQKLVGFYADVVKEQAEAQTEMWAKTQKEWREASETDKEIGGQNLTETVTLAKAGLKAFGNAGFVDLMESYGLGNHPDVLRLLRNVGKTVTEDGMPLATKGADKPKSLASRIYTSHNR